MFVIMDRDGRLHYDGPYQYGGKPLVFATEDAARKHLESGNWHLEGHKVIPRRNGGTECDNPEGPCACGAWHRNGV